jgi:Flp pilus assembly secretin CpaC
VRLNFTPTVTNIGNINLAIAPEVSSLDFAGGL